MLRQVENRAGQDAQREGRGGRDADGRAVSIDGCVTCDLAAVAGSWKYISTMTRT